MRESGVVGLGGGEIFLQSLAQILFSVRIEAPAMSRTEYGKLIEDNLDVVPIKPGHYEEVFPLPLAVKDSTGVRLVYASGERQLSEGLTFVSDDTHPIGVIGKCSRTAYTSSAEFIQSPGSCIVVTKVEWDGENLTNLPIFVI
ncbi:hypothetical protein EDD16DRAFT_1524328 [Pisolithus croceorrhizus]|nr:hypothetical protein EDD16DRAFT_1524328 [Pisolithus croceorrhizus]